MTGRLCGIGVGPGDPELLTLKAHRILTHAPVVAYPAPDDGPSFARSIVAGYLRPDQLEIPIVIPMRAERFPARAVYDRAAAEIGNHLRAGSDVCVLCEGDPFFYGSFMYLFERLAGRFATEIVPGVSSLTAAAAALKRPLAARNDVLAVVPAPRPDAEIGRVLDGSEAVAIVKVGRHLGRVRALIEAAGLLARAGYVERVGLASERVMPLAETTADRAPYFSIILVYKGAEGWINNLSVL
ncbi:MAG: precorrin-2 C(20)-methyltransferase [Alphaproteobacteria bacterium]|nr:MAG: precorrin-2 C(20)-methyltransferase [Alphaproteobacteria bacterium]